MTRVCVGVGWGVDNIPGETETWSEPLTKRVEKLVALSLLLDSFSSREAEEKTVDG